MQLRHLLVTTVATSALLATPAAAVAQDYPGGTTESRVEGDSLDRPDAVLGTGAVRGETSSPGAVVGVDAAPARLPVTGGDLAGMAIIGVALVGTGTVVLRRSRRQPQTA